ncbi:MAG TPA: hypothetical protein HPP77_04735 [Candidatus Hydrogenedentes bacterium]|nr:hypothetical protein [Candidatus Hydrogenedentota bacterium]
MKNTKAMKKQRCVFATRFMAFMYFMVGLIACCEEVVGLEREYPCVWSARLART